MQCGIWIIVCLFLFLLLSVHNKTFFPILQVKMGLLVDLTNTTRFYDRNDIEKDGIKYVKLQCKGYEK